MILCASMVKATLRIKRVRQSITLHPKIYEWVAENIGSSIDDKKFRTLSDAIEQGLLLLKNKIESEK